MTPRGAARRPPRSSLHIFKDMEALSRKASSIFARESKRSAAAGRRFFVALSGGSSPRGMYEILSSRPFLEKVPWESIEFFWGDERCVPPEHPESNYGAAWSAFLSKVPVPEAHIHRIKGELDPREAARRYESEMKESFGGAALPAFDLVLLGMGADGHTASLFPGAGAVAEKERIVVETFVEETGSSRVTLTLRVLNHARNVVFLVTGRSKAGALAGVFPGRDSGPLPPAGLVVPATGRLLWLVDEEAASGLADR